MKPICSVPSSESALIKMAARRKNTILKIRIAPSTILPGFLTSWILNHSLIFFIARRPLFPKNYLQAKLAENKKFWLAKSAAVVYNKFKDPNYWNELEQEICHYETLINEGVSIDEETVYQDKIDELKKELSLINDDDNNLKLRRRK